jgi:hypothetical protein
VQPSINKITLFQLVVEFPSLPINPPALLVRIQKAMPLPEKNWVLLSQPPSGTFIIPRTPLVLVDGPDTD